MSKLIYFVDDDKMILNLLEYTFKSRDNYDVKTFRNGEDCLIAMSEKPALIVLDHFFIISNTQLSKGIDILKKIREVDTNVPVIMLSGENNENIINEYAKNGVDKFIIKDSYFIDSLIESIEDVFTELQ
jgi:two-component system, OmpR family, response regulator